MVYKLGELFCGPGGLALGAIQAKIKSGNEIIQIRPTWATDYDRDTCNTYKTNIIDKYETDGLVLCEDARNLDFKKLPKVDALSFGFPCNDFSLVGEKLGINGTFGPLYQYAVAAVKHFKPLWFVGENVSGLKNANDGLTFSKILNDLHSIGYNVYPHKFMFERYGVPQSRHRIIIIGFRSDAKVNYFPPAPTGELQTCKDALESPPIPFNAKNNEKTRQSENVVERLMYIRPGENAFTATIPKRLQLNVKGARISQIYKRLDPKKPAYTITGSGGGGTHVYHYKENRALTNRERARLQTFPDDYIFYGSKESVRKQIGMAVPPRGAKVIFRSILQTLSGENYKGTELTYNALK